jgi:hypothetical protein
MSSSADAALGALAASAAGHGSLGLGHDGLGFLFWHADTVVNETLRKMAGTRSEMLQNEGYCVWKHFLVSKMAL